MNEYDDLIAAQPQAAANEYDAQLQIQGDQKRQALRSSIVSTRESTPDNAAKARQLSRATGIPPDTVERNLPSVTDQVQLNAYDALLNTAPITADHLSNPDFARVAKDDAGNLQQIEHTVAPPPPKPIVNSAEFSSMVNALRTANPTMTWDDARYVASQRVTVNDTEQLAGPSRVAGPKADIGTTIDGLWQSVLSGGEAVRQGIRAQFADALGLSDMKDDAIQQYRRSQLTQDVTRPQFNGKAAKLIYGGAENVVQNAPILAAAILTRNPNIAAALAAVQTEATAYPKYRERGGTATESAVGAGIEGVIEFATEKIPLAFLTDNFGRIPTWQLFVGEQAREQITEQIATHTQDLTDALIANPTMTIAQYLQQRPDAALQTAVAVIMQGVAVATAHKATVAMAGKSEAALQADQHADMLGKLFQLSQASKVLERDPQSFEAFATAATEAGQVGDVYVDARTFAQSAGPRLAEIVQASPAVAAQLDEAMKSGGDLVIPTGEYTTRVAPLDTGNALLPHLRMGPDAFSQEEAKTFMQGQAEEFNKQTQKVLEENHFDTAFRQSAASVEKELFTQLQTANRFTDDVNMAYAKLMAAFYTVQAARLGVTPEQMYVKYPLQIKAEALAGGKAFDQGERDIVSPIDRGAPAPVKVQQMQALSLKNEPVVNEFLAGIDRMFGTESKVSHKAPESILAKAQRPSILEKKPWFDVEHVRDAFRFKTVINDIRELPHILAQLPRLGATVVKADVAKVISPKEWGWRIPAFDLRMPNGQIVEWYLPIKEQEAAKRSGNHQIFEKWRGEKFPILDPNRLREYHNDLKVSLDRYEAAWSASVARTGISETELLAALTKAAASAEPAGTLSKSSLRSSGENQAPNFHSPSTNDAAQPSESSTITRPSSALDTNIGETSNDILPQEGFEQGERGQIGFGKKGATLALLQHADLSTFLHESGHFYLEVLTDMASQPGAPAEIKADMDKLLQWFKVPDLATWAAMPLEEKRVHHEQFARGFESYLFEGKAPSQELSGLFSRFRAWLINVYKALANLNVQLTDEVRGVMDRMIATNEQIIAAEAARNYTPLFQSAEAANYTPAEWQAYQDQALTATQDAVDLLEKRSLRDMQWLTNARGRMLKKLQKDASAKRADIEQEVTAEVRAQPVYAAQRFMRYGELPEANWTNAQRKLIEEASLQGTKLNLPDLKQMYGEGPAAQWRYLPTGKTGLAVSKDGMHPDVVAELFGFKSGDELVQKVLDAQPESTVIEGMTDQRTLERYGDLAHPDTIAKAANEAIHNEARARFIATELRALEKAMSVREDTGRTDAKGRAITTPVLPKAAKEYADAIIARKKIKEVRPAQYEAAEARSAKAAEKAMPKDFPAAVQAKRDQLINHYAARAAYEAQDDFEKGLRYLRKFTTEATRKNLDTDYTDQIDGLLDRFDIRRMTDKEAARRKSLVSWVESQEAMGFSPTIDPQLLNEARRTPVREMTVEEFRGLIDAIRNIEHLGRLKKKLLTIQDQREFDAAVDTFVGSINDNAKKTVPEQRSSDRGLLVATKRLFGNFFASHRKFASQARELDGWQDNGVGWNYLVQNMNKAGDFEAVQREKATMHLHELLGPVIEQGKLGQKQYFASSGKSFTREERLAIALNMGNEINRERVMSGEHLSESQLQDVLHTLTQSDWKFVQGVWDQLESFRPMIAAKERRLTGGEPEWVAATPVQTQFGELRGGYYPIKYDPLRSDRSYADVQAEIGKQMQQGFYTRSQTRRGHLKARAESTGRPLRYDLDVITEHIGQVVHDLAWHEYLIDANRLLRSGAVEAAVRDHYGPIMLQSMKKMMNDIAIGETGAQEAGDRIMNHLRYGATIAGLGINVSNALVNMVGITQSMSRLGTKWVAKGMIHWIGDAARMEGSIDQIHEKSDFMRLRAKTLNRELNEIRNKVSGEDTKLTAAYFWLQNRTQLVVDVPTWWGGYEKAMAQPDMTEDKAVALADQAVIDAQGSGQLKDLSGVQRGGPGLKLFTTFYSFFNTTYNLTSEAVGRTNFKKPGDVVMLAADLALLYTIPALVGTLVKHLLKGDIDKPKELAKSMVADQIAYRLGSMVLLRELTPALQAAEGVGNGMGYSGPASTRFFQDFYQLGEQIKQGELDANFWKALNNVAGVLFHYPAGQINRTAQGLYEMMQGHTSNPGVLLVGPPPKK